MCLRSDSVSEDKVIMCVYVALTKLTLCYVCKVIMYFNAWQTTWDITYDGIYGPKRVLYKHAITKSLNDSRQLNKDNSISRQG